MTPMWQNVFECSDNSTPGCGVCDSDWFWKRSGTSKL